MGGGVPGALQFTNRAEAFCTRETKGTPGPRPWAGSIWRFSFWRNKGKTAKSQRQAWHLSLSATGPRGPLPQGPTPGSCPRGGVTAEGPGPGAARTLKWKWQHDICSSRAREPGCGFHGDRKQVLPRTQRPSVKGRSELRSEAAGAEVPYSAVTMHTTWATRVTGTKSTR